MNILTVFTNFNPSQIITVILLIIFALSIWSIKMFALNRTNILEVIATFAIFIVSMFISLEKGLIVVLIILSALNLLYSLFDLLVTIYVKQETYYRTTEYLKNNEYDFFIQMDNKDRIIDCSSNFLKLTKLSKKEILKNQGWKLIFESLDVVSINKEEFTLNYVAKFINEFKECNSKYKKYRFQIEVNNHDASEKTDETQLRYDAIVQPIYCGNKLVARNIYFYQDKVAVVERLKGLVRSACTDLEDAYLQLDVMMGMSEGIIMYYDFQNKVYVATECMRLFTQTTRKEYTFEELFAHIHPDDVHTYIEQAETVNSLSITKIKYRLQIGGAYYQIEEDSIYMRKDYGLISIIRIAEKTVSQNAPKNAKIINELEVLNDLSTSNITNTLDKTISILDTVLGDEEDED